MTPAAGHASTGRPTEARWLFALALLATVLPLFVVTYLPLVDLPGHLGRLHILQEYSADAELQARYELVLRPFPGLLLDGMLLLLERFWPTEDAVRIYVLLGMLTFAAGLAQLSLSLYGRLVPMTALALFVQYNSLFIYGFVSYQFGLAIFFLTFALWYRWRQQWTPLRMAGALALGVLTYFGHLSAFIFLGFSVAVTLALDWWRNRAIPARALFGSIVLAAPLALYALLGDRRGTPQYVHWSTIASKARHSFVLLIGYDLVTDIVLAVLIGAALVTVVICCKPKLHHAAGLIGGLLACGFVVAPSEFLTGSDADTRLIPPAAVFLLLGLQFRQRVPWQRVAFAVAACALVVRVGFITWTWQQQNERLLKPNIALFEQLSEGARLYPIFEPSDDSELAKFEQPLYHFVSWATVKKAAIVPTNFTVVGQHPVVNRPGYWFREVSFARGAPADGWEPVFAEYDYIWFYGENIEIRRVLEARCKIISQRGKSRLYQVLRPAQQH